MATAGLAERGLQIEQEIICVRLLIRSSVRARNDKHTCVKTPVELYHWGGGRHIQTDASEVNVTLKAFSRAGRAGGGGGGGVLNLFISCVESIIYCLRVELLRQKRLLPRALSIRTFRMG